ncbi:F-box only protein 22-like [Phymastichus coffea]|uniref:F-box only protein 22-like n=1 Tax=Phymastichus coffea TaxID=108790 RepID=UPI00273BBB2B|nr:F-box only protein 22-like [Phymastichus coffea]
MESPVKKMKIVVSTEEKSDCSSRDAQETQENVLTYDVLRVIFGQLGAKDLCSAAQVCRLWKDAASKEASLRKYPEYFLKRYKIIDRDDADNMYASELIGNELRIRPVVALICAKVQEEKEWTLKGCYCQNLPIDCNAIFLGGYDIVLNDSKIQKGFGMAVGLFLSALPKLSHKLYHVNMHTFSGSSNIDINAHAEHLVKQLLSSKKEKSKCIIMLTDHSGYQFSKVIMKNLRKQYPIGKISLWGGICTDLKVCEVSSSSRNCSQISQWAAITLSSPTLQSWSIVLSQSCRKEEEVQEKLDKFKQSIALKKHSLGLMFACCERLNKKDMEIAIFKRVFPNVPLIGLHGDGEYGLNTLNKKREDTLWHAYTTIFLVLTYQ